MRFKSLASTLVLAALSLPAQANNYPCSNSKGGVDHCNGDKFVCWNGTGSSSAQKCTPDAVREFRSEWDSDNSAAPNSQSSGQQQTVAPTPGLLLPTPSKSAPARVIDGDTIELAGETFRLEGIDAPEMKQQCLDANGATYNCGRRARDALIAMITGPVSCTVSGHDKYGRTLGYCVSGAFDLNRQMVATGWAMAFAKYNDRYSSDEAAARGEKLGLWAGKEFQAPWDWRAAQIAALQPTGNCVIKGNISKGQKIYYMPFHLMYAKVKVDEAAGERWFCTESEALDAGWKRADR